MTIGLSDYSYYIRPGFTDMRKGPYSLAGLVSSEMGHDPYDRSVYLFCGRSRKTIKALAWDGTGWLVLTKRLVVGGHGAADQRAVQHPQAVHGRLRGRSAHASGVHR